MDIIKKVEELHKRLIENTFFLHAYCHNSQSFSSVLYSDLLLFCKYRFHFLIRSLIFPVCNCCLNSSSYITYNMYLLITLSLKTLNIYAYN